MSDNEFPLKITGDATQAIEAITAAQEQLDKAGKSVELLANLIGVKVPDAFKKMIASSELVGPALAEAFGPLSLIVFGIEILQRIAEKMEQMDEEAEKHRLAWQDIGIASDDATRKIEDSIAKQEQKYIEITQGPIAGMEFALGHMRSVALSAFADIAGAMDRVAAELTEESSWFNVNKEAAADIKATIGDMHKAMDDAAKAAPKDPFAPIIAQEKILNDKIKETNDLIRRRSANMGEDKSLVDPLKQEVALYENILSKLRLQKDLQAEALKTANAEINKAKTDRSVTIDVAKIEADKKTNDAIIQQDKETIRELAAAHQISAEDELALNKTVLGQKFTQDGTALNKKLDQLNRDRDRNAAQIITVQGEIKALAIQHYTELEKLNADYYKQVDHNGQEAVDKAAAKMHAFLQQVKESQQIILESAKAHEAALGQLSEQRLAFDLSIGKISESEYEHQLAVQLEKTYENEKAKLALKLEAAKGDMVETARINAELEKLEDKHNADLEKADENSFKRRTKVIDAFFSHMKSGMDSAISGMLKGTESFSKAMQQMWADMVVSVAQYLADMMLKWVQHHLAMLVVHATEKEDEVETDASAAAQKDAVDKTFYAKSGLRAATDAAKKSFDWASQYVGPILAAPIAAAAFVAVESFGSYDAGTNYVPMDGLAMLHKGEKVIPASQQGPAYTDVGGITVVVNHSVSAVDAASFQGHIRRHSNMIANEVTRALKRKGAR